jgi:hypothetical protein
MLNPSIHGGNTKLTHSRLLSKTQMVKLLRPMNCLQPRAKSPKLVPAHLVKSPLANMAGLISEVYSVVTTQMSKTGRSRLQRLKLLMTRLFVSRLVALVNV